MGFFRPLTTTGPDDKQIDLTAFTDAQRAALLAEWPKTAAINADAMLAFLFDRIGWLRSFAEDGDLEPSPLPAERAREWRRVAKAAEEFESALRAVSEDARNDAAEHDLNTTQHSDRGDDRHALIDSQVRRTVETWKRQALHASILAERWAGWSEQHPTYDSRNHRPLDLYAHEIAEKAGIAWLAWSGKRITVGVFVNKRGVSVGTPAMRFMVAAMRVAECETSGIGIARAVAEEIRDLGPAMDALVARETMREPAS